MTTIDEDVQNEVLQEETDPGFVLETFNKMSETEKAEFQDTHFILYIRGDGLGGRIRTFMVARELALSYGLPVLFIWPNTIGYPSTFDNVFDPSYYDHLMITDWSIYNNKYQTEDFDFIRQHLIDNLDQIQHQTVSADKRVFRPFTNEWLLKLLKNPEHSFKSQMFLRDPIESNILFVRKGFISNPILPYDIYWNQEAVLKANQFKIEHDLTEYIGVHVRRGDLLGKLHNRKIKQQRALKNNQTLTGNLKEIPNPKTAEEINEYKDKGIISMRLRAIELYYEGVDSFPEGLPIFLCTDDGTVIEDFKNRYPGRIHNYPISNFSQKSIEGTSMVLIDWLIFSGAKYMVCDNNSNFSGAAIVYGLVSKENINSF